MGDEAESMRVLKRGTEWLKVERLQVRRFGGSTFSRGRRRANFQPSNLPTFNLPLLSWGAALWLLLLSAPAAAEVRRAVLSIEWGEWG
jgi:hypothetical protein